MKTEWLIADITAVESSNGAESAVFLVICVFFLQIWVIFVAKKAT